MLVVDAAVIHPQGIVRIPSQAEGNAMSAPRAWETDSDIIYIDFDLSGCVTVDAVFAANASHPPLVLAPTRGGSRRTG